MIVITGAAGFIGSALAFKLNELGKRNLLLVDHLGSGEKWKNLVPLQYQDYLEKGDLMNYLNSGSKSLGKIKAVIHLGACSSTTESDASYLVNNNFFYSKSLAEWSVRNKVRFLYASSAATYGDGSNGYSDDTKGLDSLRPLNMYGYSKQMFDQWVKSQGLFTSLVGLKYFNVFGPNEYHKGDMRSVVHKAYGQIRDSGKVKLFKSYHPDFKHGEQKRDFIYVVDAVNMTLHFLKGKRGGLYNIGSGAANTWLDLAKSLFSALGKKPNIEFIPMPSDLQSKYQYYTRAELGRIRKSGYKKPITSLSKAVLDYAKYLKSGKRLGE